MSENIFKENIKGFQYVDLDDKTMIIKVIDAEECTVVYGIDVNTKIKYILHFQIKNEYRED